MKTIEKYQAKDGREFANPVACLAHEDLCEARDVLMSLLRPIPKDDGCSFANGNGFVQQDKAVVSEVRSGLERLAGMDGKPFGYIGRCLDDSDSPLYSAWVRVAMCVDSQGREWGQPYYAMNPGAGKMMAL